MRAKLAAVTASFEAAGPLAEEGQGHTATLLPDGRALVLGGIGDDCGLASAEVWEPATDGRQPTTTWDYVMTSEAVAGTE